MPKLHFAGSNRTFVDTFYHLDTGAYATSGDVYYVSSTASGATDSAGYGRTPDAPFATIAYAVGTAATANNRDVVFVLPGHTETITGAAGVAMSKAGVQLVGVGRGRLQPVVNYTTATAASFDITAANCAIENITFTPIGVDAVTAGINVNAADVSIVNCEFELGNATNQATLGILTNAAANRFLLQDCWFHQTTDAGTTAAISIVGGDSIRIVNNTFQGAYTAGIGAINQITTTTTNAIIRGNIIQNFTASSTKAMVFTASSTGQISQNFMQILSGTAPITGAAMSWVGGNYYAATIATAGTLI